jgi:hypothetical protein
MMKNTYKKNLIAGAILALASAHCLADQVNAQVIPPPPPPAQAQVLPVAPVTTGTTKTATEVVSGAAALAELKSQEEAPATLYSKLNPAQTEELRISEVNAKKLDELTRQRDQAEAELAIIKIEADKARTESDIRKLKGEKLPSEIQAAEDQAQQGATKNPNSKLSPLDKVFVTQIYGMSGDEQVTVFYENSILKVKRGDEVTDGVRMTRVVANGADFTYKGVTKRVTLTTQKQAFSRTFSEPKVETNTSNNFMPGGMMPVMQPPVGAYRATPMN